MNQVSERTFASSRFKGVSLIRKFINFSIYSNLFVASVTVSASLYWQIKTNLYSLEYSLFLFFSTVFIYNLERTKIKPRDIINKPKRTAWLAQNRILLTVLSCISFLGYSYLFLNGLSFSRSIFVLSLLILSLIYCSEKLFNKIYGMKHILLGLIWAAACILGPVLWINGEPNTKAMQLTALYFLIAVSNSIICDREDVHGDKNDGIKSLPVIMKNTHLRLLANTLIISLGIGAWILNFKSLLIISIIYMLCLNSKPKAADSFICDFALALPLLAFI
ncbi:MAG: UbiA family prenyltransferase [Lentisphaeraceae bacterium]|nr:UbiA family prenyltransferase [Lentisphaeraceae bacterium]